MPAGPAQPLLDSFNKGAFYGLCSTTPEPLAMPRKQAWKGSFVRPDDFEQQKIVAYSRDPGGLPEHVVSLSADSPAEISGWRSRVRSPNPPPTPDGGRRASRSCTARRRMLPTDPTDCGPLTQGTVTGALKRKKAHTHGRAGETAFVPAASPVTSRSSVPRRPSLVSAPETAPTRTWTCWRAEACGSGAWA